VSHEGGPGENRGGSGENSLIDPHLEQVLEELSAAGRERCDEVEIYAKQGRSRKILLSGEFRGSVASEESGWAVRGSTRRGSFLAAGTGRPPQAGSWPEADGLPFRLPSPEAAPAWQEPADFAAPLIGEREGSNFLEAVATALGQELPGARLLEGSLEDGASEVQILNSRGIRARHRNRLAALRLEAIAGPGVPSAALYLAEREARKFRPLALARRLADRLTILTHGEPRSRDRGEFLLAPPVMARLLDLLRPLLIGEQAAQLARQLADSRGRLGSDKITVLDNGRLPGGAFEAPVDGEGVPTREALLIDRGTFSQPLLSWQQAQESHRRGAGCSRRASWRDLPKAGPTHLYLRPQAGVSVADLLGQVHRGYYLLEATGAAEVEASQGRFSLPVCGFEIRSGRASGPVKDSYLCGTLTGFLQGVQGVGRDLAFTPLDGLLGSPTALVTGLELRGSRPALAG
jgi:predicted Zn-dependent protease